MQLDHNGYYDLPPGKIASLVTYLEMTEPPAPRALPDGPGLALRRVERPKLDWYRDLFRRIGTDWLSFGRLVMPDGEVEAIIRHPEVEVYALTRDWQRCRFARAGPAPAPGHRAHRFRRHTQLRGRAPAAG